VSPTVTIPFWEASTLDGVTLTWAQLLPVHAFTVWADACRSVPAQAAATMISTARRFIPKPRRPYFIGAPDLL
jgi:hypothetical protein